MEAAPTLKKHQLSPPAFRSWFPRQVHFQRNMLSSGVEFSGAPTLGGTSQRSKSSELPHGLTRTVDPESWHAVWWKPTSSSCTAGEGGRYVICCLSVMLWVTLVSIIFLVLLWSVSKALNIKPNYRHNLEPVTKLLEHEKDGNWILKNHKIHQRFYGGRE